jgi:hypothetical protein
MLMFTSLAPTLPKSISLMSKPVTFSVKVKVSSNTPSVPLGLLLVMVTVMHPFCNLQSRAQTHAVLVIGLYQLVNPTT